MYIQDIKYLVNHKLINRRLVLEALFIQFLIFQELRCYIFVFA